MTSKSNGKLVVKMKRLHGPKRQMPHSKDAKTNGTFDLDKFLSLQGAAKSAIDSGSTAIKDIHISAGGGPINPRVIAALQTALLQVVNDGVVKLGDINEGPHADGGGHDEFVLQEA